MRATKGWEWTLEPDKGVYSYDQAQLSVLMDIRDELRALRRIFECPNFTAIPRMLKRVSANTAKPRKRRPVLKRAA